MYDVYKLLQKTSKPKTQILTCIEYILFNYNYTFVIYRTWSYEGNLDIRLDLKIRYKTNERLYIILYSTKVKTLINT